MNNAKQLPPNRFYLESDVERFAPHKARDEIRSPFEIDRDRIIYTSAFRRLQSKTQVFMAGEYDFYRTRLTHSIEVAQAGRSICHYLRRTSEYLSSDFFIDADLVEAVCLAHDLGHPPFGHAGERALNRLMAPYGGFEGNAQTARLLTQTIYGEGAKRHGMEPTRSLLDGILKYKTLRRDLPETRRESHFLYDDQVQLLDFITATHPPAAEQLSVECQIMDWADDTAYSINDLVDGYHAGFITGRHVRDWAASRELDAANKERVEEMAKALDRGRVDAFFGKKTGDFIRACRIVPRVGAAPNSPPRHRFDLAVDKDVLSERRVFGQIAVDLVFKAPPLQHLEHKSHHILSALFALYQEHHICNDGGLKLLPPATTSAIAATAEPDGRARLLCDYLAGMTDGFAIRTYKRMFDPDFGSITDLP